jgi:5-methyltetrahydropteroyltriglutamate--homocysteine methyltransferase
MSVLPLFPVTTVGSWPRPHTLLAAQRAHRAGEISRASHERAVAEAVREAVEAQHRAGVDVVTDGEQARDNFYSFVADKLDGVQLMTLAELLEVVADKEGFGRLLDTLDVPAFAIRNPTCVGRLRPREPLALGDLERLRRFTGQPVKVTLPGPYLLTRAMWVPEVSLEAYASKEALGEDVVSLLRDEIARLVAAGADFIQLDEPVLTELVFSKGLTRTFMCASLAARGDPTEELMWAVEMLREVLVAAGSTRTGLHVCRGNWSRDERTLLRGSYAPLATWLDQVPVTQLVLEYATPRAGAVISPGGKELGLGVVNPRTDATESVESIVQRVESGLRVVPRERLFLNPDCGFGTFSARAVNSAEVAERKLAAMAEAARRLR